jgi:hypothetical protein
MPAVSSKQQRWAGAELARKKAGKKTRSGMSLEQLRDFAKTPRGNSDITSPLGLSKKKIR